MSKKVEQKRIGMLELIGSYFAVLFTLFMKYFFLVVLMFFFIYPTNFIFLPVPTDRVFQVLGFLLIILFSIYHGKIYQDTKLGIFLLIGILMVIVTAIALFWSPHPDTYLVKKEFDVLLGVFSTSFVILCFAQVLSRITLGKFLDYLVYAVFIQALVSVYLFFNPALLEKFVMMTRMTSNEAFMSRLDLIELRLMGISNSFFTASINYGVHFLILMYLPYCKTSTLAKNKFWYYLMMVTITGAGVFSGRTVLVAIALGLGYVFLMERRRIIGFIGKSFRFILVGCLIAFTLYFILRSYVDLSRMENLFSWAFEIFIQLGESGQLSSSSTDVMMNMYVWPEADDIKTWLWGHGMINDPAGGYYMGTDVGYVRLVYYYGLTGLACFVASQIGFYLLAASYYRSKATKLFILFLLLWAFVLNLKGLSIINFYYTLFFVFGFLKERQNSVISQNGQHIEKTEDYMDELPVKKLLKW